MVTTINLTCSEESPLVMEPCLPPTRHLSSSSTDGDRLRPNLSAFRTFLSALILKMKWITFSFIHLFIFHFLFMLKSLKIHLLPDDLIAIKIYVLKSEKIDYSIITEHHNGSQSILSKVTTIGLKSAVTKFSW